MLDLSHACTNKSLNCIYFVDELNLTFPNLESDGGSDVHEVLASVSFLLLGGILTKFVTFELLEMPDVLFTVGGCFLTALSVLSEGALVVLFLAAFCVILSSLCDTFSSTGGFLLGVCISRINMLY
jgi:hypothetical protein